MESEEAGGNDTKIETAKQMDGKNGAEVTEKSEEKRLTGILRRGIGHVYVIIVVFFGWILFRFTDLSAVGTVVRGLFAANGNAWTDGTTELLLKNNCFFLLFAVIAVLPLGKKLRDLALKKGSGNPYLGAVVNVVEVATPVVLLVLSLMALVGDSYNPFLYFQF